MPRAPSPLLRLLQRGQRYILYVSSLAYVAYVLISALLNAPGPFPAAFQTPKYWGAAVALATVAALAAAPQRLREIFTAASLAYALVIVAEVPRLIAAGQPPLNLMLWLCTHTLVAFVVFGARWGVVWVLSLLGMVLSSLVLRGPLPSAQLADWVTGALAAGLVAVIASTLMTFIENNLLQHEEDHEKLRAARQDAVTDVYGRGAIEEELRRALEHARKTATPLSIIVTDIDHFKAVNDQHGHACGDDVLRAVAKRLRRNVGGMGGLVGRWGGEEFIVVLSGLAKPDALVLAERLRREISDTPLADLNVTASFGVASYRGTGDTPEQLFGRADMAMYQAKRAGRNAVR